MNDDVDSPEAPEYVKPNPAQNPRNMALGEIAAARASRVEAETAEDNNFPSVDDDHNITAAAPEPVEPSTPSETAPTPPEQPLEAAAPDPEEELLIEGQAVKVPTSKLLDAGRRTFQKEAAADHRLQVASKLLEEAERRLAATPPGAEPSPPPAPAGSNTEAELAHMLQFGTPEQSAEAVRQLRGGGVDESRIQSLADERARMAARDEMEFARGKAFIQKEYSDILTKDSMRGLFFSEDSRLLAAGDRRPYVERYRAIGDQMRKDFGLVKPAPQVQAAGEPSKGTVAARQAAKAAAPSVPRTAAARLGEGGGEQAKPKTSTEIIASMAAARGKNRLSEPPPTRR